MNHTDVESPAYKNHQILINLIHELQMEIQDTRKLIFESNTRQADENRKISRRVDEVLKVCIKDNSKLENDLINLELKVEELEKNPANNFSPDAFIALNVKIDELENLYKIFKNYIEGKIFNKVPHKCPVCEGNCMRPNPLANIENMKMPVNLDCLVCDGKGILWG